MVQLGKIVIAIGILLIVGGIVIYFWGNKLTWLGNLPGDIRVDKENFRFYFPITTMIIISVIITVLVRIFNKFFN